MTQPASTLPRRCVRFLWSVLRRTGDQARRWGLWVAIVLEIITISVLLLVKGLSFHAIEESALLALSPILALGIVVFLWNLVSEPHRCVVARLDKIETRSTLSTVWPSTVDLALKEIKGRFLRLVKNFRHLLPVGSTIRSYHAFDRETVRDLDDEIRFFIGETKPVADLHDRLQHWFLTKGREGVSVATALWMTHTGEGSFSRKEYPSLHVRETFLRQKMTELQDITNST